VYGRGNKEDDMPSGTYVGPLAHLRGERAILDPRKQGWAAQFSTIGLTRKPGGFATPVMRTDLGYHWHWFARTDFIVDPATVW
jgi:hypothetical protein